MASVIREYTLKLTTKEAQQNLKQVTDSLELQDQAIHRINKDLLQYEKDLEKVHYNDFRRRDDLIKKIANTNKEL